ncbi:hypothetical protein [Bacillus sp. 1NLA3E]|uniref:hypothetical protein n=1 Tax=Bacillus sp. 1NLA3E TaxID=666686 RepID=UPI000327F583|nr:hypothetical protein [Bacillus sp. 1NLA3E]AGK52015.1 hypothetical protein B1NLA3E_01155 [Bacillus sp. 1NLA3E]
MQISLPIINGVVLKVQNQGGVAKVNETMEYSIKKLNEAGLFLLYRDVVNRIGSHVIGGSPDVNYIQNQEAILNVVQDELQKRK